MKLSIAKRMLVNNAIEYAQRVTKDVTRYAAYADQYIEAVKRNAMRDKITVLEAAASHILISRSAKTTYKQLRRLYPPLPGAHLPETTPPAANREPSPPGSNTGETFEPRERPGGFLGAVLVDGKPVDVFDVLGDYV